MRSHSIALWSWCAAMTVSIPAFAAEPSRSTLPDEITALGGQGSALAGSGAALVSDQSAIRVNPAMLYRHRNYDVAGSYIWPTAGRPFYRVAAIDGVTSKWSTGFEYTGFADALESREKRLEKDGADSPVRRRASLGFSIPTNLAAVGFAGHYVEADDVSKSDSSTVKGFTLGAGIVAQLSETIRFGASLENFNNKKVKNVSPQTLRAGFAYENAPGTFGLYADYRDRERSRYLEGIPLTDEGTLALAVEDIQALPSDQPHEKMTIVGGHVQTFDVLRIFFAGGRNVGGERAEVLSGGLGIYQKNFSLAYAVSRTYPDVKDLQNSVSLSITLKM